MKFPRFMVWLNLKLAQRSELGLIWRCARKYETSHLELPLEREKTKQIPDLHDCGNGEDAQACKMAKRILNSNMVLDFCVNLLRTELTQYGQAANLIASYITWVCQPVEIARRVVVYLQVIHSVGGYTVWGTARWCWDGRHTLCGGGCKKHTHYDLKCTLNYFISLASITSTTWLKFVLVLSLKLKLKIQSSMID